MNQNINSDKPYYIVDDKENKKMRRMNKLLLYGFYLFAIFVVVLGIYLYRIDKYEVYLKNKEVMLDLGSTYQVELIPKNAAFFDISNYEYESENPSVAIVTDGGTITSVGKGITNIVIKYKNSFNEKKIKVISDDVNVESLQIENIDNIEVNENKIVKASVNGQNNIQANVTYESDNQSVIMVDDYGNLNAIKEGTATITVRSDNGVENKKTIKVLPSNEVKLDDILENNPEPIVVNPEPSNNNVKETTPVEKKNTEIMVTSVKLNITSTTLTVGDSISLKATISPSNATNLAINWSSSNNSVATVVNGKVVTLKAGNAVIKATSSNGKTAICDLIVKAKETPKPTTVTPTPTPTPTPTQPKVDKTPPSGTCKAVLKGGSTTVTVSTASSVAKYIYNGKETTSKTYTQSGYLRDANVVLYGTNGVSTKINCQIDYQTLPVYSNKKGTTVKSGNTDTLKVDIRKHGDMYLSYIWVRDANQQLYKRYAKNLKPDANINKAVSERNLVNKLVIGFNSSVPVGEDGSETFMNYWRSNSNYHYREPSPLMIANGQVLVNDPNQSYGKNCSEFFHLYWIDGNNNLNATSKYLCNYTVEERRQIFNQVIASGARNTMVFRPILVSNYQAATIGKNFLSTADSKKQNKQAFCQIDSNNFILVSGEKYYMKGDSNIVKYLINLGCKTAVEFDAGGSTAVVFKNRGASSSSVIYGNGRKLTMVMYFTE